MGTTTEARGRWYSWPHNPFTSRRLSACAPLSTPAMSSLCAAAPGIAHLLCTVLLLYENLPPWTAKFLRHYMIRVVLCRFMAMSLANTAVSGAIMFFYIGENYKMRNSTAQVPAQVVW